jgi:hypothetical protein
MDDVRKWGLHTSHRTLQSACRYPLISMQASSHQHAGILSSGGVSHARGRAAKALDDGPTGLGWADMRAWRETRHDVWVSG